MSTSEPGRPVAILKSSDLVATMAWYESIGFALTGREPGAEPTWCQLERDGLVIQFLAGETPWPERPAFTGTLYVHPASVTETYAEIAGSVPGEWGVEEREWGARELTLRDPDGYFVTFTEPA